MNNNLVLCVDDEDDNLFLYKLMLKRYDYDVVTINGAVEAIDYMRKALEEGIKIDITIVDLMMPVKTGIEVLQDFRELGYEGKALIGTANRSIEMEDIPESINACSTIFKPFEIPEFKKAVDCSICPFSDNCKIKK